MWRVELVEARAKMCLAFRDHVPKPIYERIRTPEIPPLVPLLWQQRAGQRAPTSALHALLASAPCLLHSTHSQSVISRSGLWCMASPTADGPPFSSQRALREARRCGLRHVHGAVRLHARGPRRQGLDYSTRCSKHACSPRQSGGARRCHLGELRRGRLPGPTPSGTTLRG